jgi:tryptophan halogenase
MLDHVAILGAGSAGLIAALTMRRRFPQLPVTVIRSRDIGIIGVGEGTTQQFPRFFFKVLGLDQAQFYAETQPTWKLGLRFLWGPRRHFHYTFSEALDARWPELPRNHGFYFEDAAWPVSDIWSACAAHDRALPRTTAGLPWFNEHTNLAFHLENARLVAYLEARCRENGIAFLDATVTGVEKMEVRGQPGVRALILDSGERVTADVFVDASGFRSELLGRALEEPFRDFGNALFCDRAVIAGWPRTTEPLRPYTTCETMDAGWCWQIEHEHFINRGYVYSSRFLDDDTARREFLEKNPKVAGEPRVVRFRTGRYARSWVGNVVAVGNASGFVEPLEATALAVICAAAGTLADVLADTAGELHPTALGVFNRYVGGLWDDTRDFLAIHYAFNTRTDTPFWQHCRAETPLGAAEGIVEFFRENGPSSLAKTVLLDQQNPFGWEGYLALLVGQGVPYLARHSPTQTERALWEQKTAEMRLVGERAFSVSEALAVIRQPTWRWS